MSKSTMRCKKSQAKTECSNLQLWVGLEVGIEKVVHAANNIYENEVQLEDWGFLLINAKMLSMKATGVCSYGL